MRGISGSFLCLFLTVVVGRVQGGLFDKCLDDLHIADYSKCKDYEKAIDCLKKVNGTHDETEEIDIEIKYLQMMNMKETCLVLGEKKTCVSQEIETCTENSRGSMDNITMMCNSARSTYDCLIKLNSTCSNHRVLVEVDFYQEMKTSCESGEYKTDMERELCDNEIVACTAALHGRLNSGDFKDACDMATPSLDCLENIQVVCDQDYILSMKSDLNETIRQCNSGILNGKCSYNAVEKCTEVIFGKMDDMFGQRSVSDSISDEDWSSWNAEIPSSCTKANMAAATQCLNDLEPECTSEEQLSLHKYYAEEMDEFCQTNQ